MEEERVPRKNGSQQQTLVIERLMDNPTERARRRRTHSPFAEWLEVCGLVHRVVIDAVDDFEVAMGTVAKVAEECSIHIGTSSSQCTSRTRFERSARA